MPRINKYQLDSTISDTDKLIGTDENGNTRNFKIKDLSNFFAENSGTFKHVQNSASATWTVTHNLDLTDHLPHVSLKIDSGTYDNVQGTGIVTYVNKNQLTIAFSSAQSGFAYIKK